MSNLSRLSQAVLHAHAELANAKTIAEGEQLNLNRADAIHQINQMVTCEFALDDAVHALRTEEKSLKQ